VTCVVRARESGCARVCDWLLATAPWRCATRARAWCAHCTLARFDGVRTSSRRLAAASSRAPCRCEQDVPCRRRSRASASSPRSFRAPPERARRAPPERARPPASRPAEAEVRRSPPCQCRTARRHCSRRERVRRRCVSCSSVAASSPALSAPRRRKARGQLSDVACAVPLVGRRPMVVDAFCARQLCSRHVQTHGQQGPQAR
jgi:hypothetical protein